MLALIAANAVPLIGVFVFRWEVFPLLLLFWSENVVIGLLNAVKILFASPAEKGQWGLKLFFIPFFCFHYGLFTFVHGIFIVTLFGGGMKAGGFPTMDTLINLVRESHLGWAFLGLFISHAISLGHNYFTRGEFRRAHVVLLMFQPYGRIIVLHVTILLGGTLMMVLKSPVAGLALLVVLKTMLDLNAHLRERERFAHMTNG